MAKIINIKSSKEKEEYICHADFESFFKEYIELDKEYIKIDKEFGKKWKIPSHLPSTELATPKRKGSPEKILKPLDHVFFNPSLMDELIVRTSVPQLISSQRPLFPGVILFGPPGTGKSEFQDALVEVYQNTGAFAEKVSASEINSCWVGQFAKNLEAKLRAAAEEGIKTGLPALLSFDEGTILAQKADGGSVSVAKHYQEAIDVIKRYVGNEAGKYLVLSISTNLLPEDFEEAVTRDGRLTSFFIDYPAPQEVAKMWKYFLQQNKILNVDNSQSAELAALSGRESGALIATFCTSYHMIVRTKLLQAQGYSTLLDALRVGKNVPEKEVHAAYTFEQLRTDIVSYLESRQKRNSTKEKRVIGFNAL